MNDLSYYFNNMFDNLMYELPSVFKALLLLLLAWAVATFVRNIVQKAFDKTGASQALSRTPFIQDENEGKRFLENISKFIYFLVFILFLPSVFNALNMTEVAHPITNMMDKLLGFIPGLIAAGIIIVIGVFIARLVKGLFTRFFQTLNLDKWFKKINPDNVEQTEVRTTLSNVLANIIYILVLIPFITIALEALNIDTISQPIQSVLNDVLAIIPNIFVAIILVIAGYYIGKLVGNLLTGLLQGTGINNIYQSIGLSDETKKPSFDLANVLGKVVQVLVVLFFTVEALSVLNLHVLNMIGYAVIEYLPFLLSALLILGGGLFIANLLGNWVKKHMQSSVGAILIKGIIITFAVFMTLDQLHFATRIINVAFLLILGGLMVAFAISFGIGGREFAKHQLAKFQNKLEEDKDQTS